MSFPRFDKGHSGTSTENSVKAQRETMERHAIASRDMNVFHKLVMHGNDIYTLQFIITYGSNADVISTPFVRVIGRQGPYRESAVTPICIIIHGWFFCTT